MGRIRTILTALVLLVSGQVSAAIIYTYTGSDLTHAHGEEVPLEDSSLLPSGLTHISIRFHLDAPLGINHGRDRFTLNTYTFFDGLTVITQDSPGGRTSARISTDENGEILDWDIWATQS